MFEHDRTPPIDRRSLLVGLATGLVGCATARSAEAVASAPAQPDAAGTPKAGAVQIGLVGDDVQRYCVEHTMAESEVMRAISEETKASTEWWIMMVGPMEGALLRLLARLTGAKTVLELGTFTGYSAIAMAEGLPSGSQVITCDISEEWTSIAKRHWAKSPHGKKIRLELRPAIETLKRLDGPFDFVFIDADKDSQIQYWEAIVPKLSPHGLIAVDNVLSRGRVVDPEGGAQVIREFNDHVMKDRRMQSVMLPVRDGLTIAWKTLG